MLSEFRQDLVSGEWILFSTARGKRLIKEKKKKEFYQSKEDCPFEDPEGSGQEIVWAYPDKKSWQVMVIKNKFPAVKEGICGPSKKFGPFLIHDAIGNHEVIVFRDHDKGLGDLELKEISSIINVYKKRYQEIAVQAGCTKYIMIFNNYGPEAGASIYHPHSQIISTPILPPDVKRSLEGAYKFYKKNKKRVYDVIINWEIDQKKRIIYENDFFIAFCPFFSKSPYEIRIFSKESHSHFEKMPDSLDEYLADILSKVFRKIKVALNNPSYNFFIHTAPLDPNLENIHEFYHWHIEILPKLSIPAGFEMGTGIDINFIDPDQAAEILRNV